VSWYLQNQVCENADAGIYKSDTEFAVMRALVSFADNDGQNCFPSFPKLLERVRCKRTTLYKVLKEFAKRGWITIEHTRSSNVYQIFPHGCVRPSSSKSEHLDLPGGSKSEHQGFKIRTQEVQNLNARGSNVEHNSSHILQSETASQRHSFSNSADALLEKERESIPQGSGKEEGNQEEASLVTKLREPSGVRTPLDCEGYPPAARPGPEAHKYRCGCGFKHPPGMPSLEEIRVEFRKLHPEAEYLDVWVAEEAELLHDVWLANGFEMKNGPIKNWKASLRNWIRCRREN
jgi:hypothetical protein